MFPQLPDSHIGTSLSCSFEQLVLKETGGKGVNVVVNSLSGDKAVASLRCLAKSGSFVELQIADPNKPVLPDEASSLLAKYKVR